MVVTSQKRHQVSAFKYFGEVRDFRRLYNIGDEVRKNYLCSCLNGN